MTRPRFLWPVYGFRNGIRETVAVFFDWSASVDFINASDRNLYQAKPQYDRLERRDSERTTDQLERELKRTVEINSRRAA